MKKIFIVANFKMKMVYRNDITTYCDYLRKSLSSQSSIKDNVDIILCPSAPHYNIVERCSKADHRISCGAQGVFWERKGSFTGQISPVTLSECGVKYVLVGHSEQRRFGNDNNENVGKKVAAILQSKMKPIIFIGGQSKERYNDIAQRDITDQIESLLRNISYQDIKNCIFVYEPVWAVGDGTEVPTSEEIMSVCILINKIITNICGNDYSNKAIILYGGSVTSKNIDIFTKDIGLSGVVLGRAALKYHNLIDVAQSFVRNNS